MVKIQFLKRFKNYVKGEIVDMESNNDVHTLIDNGYAKLFEYENKMMTTRRYNGKSRSR